MEKKTITIDIETADCLIQHMDALLDQAAKGLKANFGEPCSKCIHARECERDGFDWYGKVSPLLKETNATIHVCF